MNRSGAERAFVVAAIALAIYQLSAGIGTAILGDDSDRLIFVAMLALGGGLVFQGLRLRQRAPLRGGLTIALGVVPSILMLWMIVPPFIALAVAIYAVSNGRKQGREQGAA